MNIPEKIIFRAQILAKIREFFRLRKVLEVETPLLCPTTIPASYLHSFKICGKEASYLQTSPEFAMKKLLARGSGDIYQICKAFRAEEAGRLHNPEFTILEWYRLGFNHHSLMDEMDDLLHHLLETKKAERFSYAEVFQKYLNLDPHLVTVHELQSCIKDHNLKIHGNFANKDILLQLLMASFIEPNLGTELPFFIYDYPASQAALAKIHEGQIPVAERFEVYFHGIELANGFHELNDPVEQRVRFEQDLKERCALGLPEIPLDEEFLECLSNMPDCSGVALGVDRLLMLAANANALSEVMNNFTH